MIVSISGPMHVGKTTLAKALVYHYEHSYRKPMATQLRDLLDKYKIKETRENLQRIGQGLRDCDPDVWVKAWMRDNGFLVMDNLVIIDDARYQNEVDLADIAIYLDLRDADTQWDRFRTSDKYDPAILRSDWNKARVHRTETQPLNFDNKPTLMISTLDRSQKEVFDEVLGLISPRIEQPVRKEVMELPW
jgi:hypothetical protein